MAKGADAVVVELFPSGCVKEEATPEAVSRVRHMLRYLSAEDLARVEAAIVVRMAGGNGSFEEMFTSR